MTRDQLSALLHKVGDAIEKVQAADANGTLMDICDTIQQVRSLNADGTLQGALNFCRKWQDSNALLWLVSQFSQETQMAQKLTAVQSDSIKAKMVAAGCPSGQCQSIIDWFSSLGLSFDNIVKIFDAVVAVFSGGSVSWAAIWQLIQTIITIVHPAPVPPPVIVP